MIDKIIDTLFQVQGSYVDYDVIKINRCCDPLGIRPLVLGKIKDFSY